MSSSTELEPVEEKEGDEQSLEDDSEVTEEIVPKVKQSRGQLFLGTTLYITSNNLVEYLLVQV